MVRYQVILAYDGAAYRGFQRQAGKTRGRTVQGVFELALRKIGWSGEKILSAGRTDSGVHAAGQVVSFDLEWNHTPAELLAALNANLPEDVAARRLEQVEANFHPRYNALSRRYAYRIFIDPIRNPIRERFAWRVWPEVSLERMQMAAANLVGTHDFRAFGTPLHSGGTTVRCVYLADWMEEGSDLIFHIRANAFLYRMVRKITAYLVGIGHGRLPIESAADRLQDGDREGVKTIAPAHGLVLEEVEYPDHSG